MAETQDIADEPEKKSSKMPLIIGLVLALAGGGGGFYAVYSGIILGNSDADSSHEEMATDTHGTDSHADDGHGVAHGTSDYDMAFVPVDPMVISLGSGSRMHHLRFRAQLEVDSSHRAEVEHLLPRVVDVLNGYLRALEIADIEDRAALIKLRSQMLRRVQVVTGPGRVNDLLVMEFVLN